MKRFSSRGARPERAGRGRDTVPGAREKGVGGRVQRPRKWECGWPGGQRLGEAGIGGLGVLGRVGAQGPGFGGLGVRARAGEEMSGTRI